MNAVAQVKPCPERLLNSELEAQALAMLMLDNRRVDLFAETVTRDDFGEAAFGLIYERIVQLVSAGQPANPVTLRPYFIDDPVLAPLGGPAFLAQLTGGSAIATLIAEPRQIARILADLGRRRRLFHRMKELTDEIESSSERTVEAVVDSIDGALTQALNRAETAQQFSGGKAFDMTLAGIEAEARGEVPPGLAIDGFDDWNAITGPMRRGNLIILAGRPGMGKTAVMLRLLTGAARAGWGSLGISLEMDVAELMKRVISDLIFEYGVSASFENVKRGKFTQWDRNAIAQARDAVKRWPLQLRQDAGMRLGRLVMTIRRTRRQMAAKGQSLDLVMIDYLQLISGDDRRENRTQEVGAITRALKTLARELDIAIVLLSQLNRAVEQRDNKRPMLSDLRDSGEIEQDADTVVFVYRDQYYLEQSPPDPGDKKYEAWDIAHRAARDRVELIAAKVRNGRVGKRRCWFFGEHQAVRGSDFQFGTTGFDL